MQPAPTQHPLIIPVSATTLLSSLIAYNSTKAIGTLGTIVSGVSGLIGVWGTWVVSAVAPAIRRDTQADSNTPQIIFGESSSISKTTGADKHTSRFLFGNKAAASAVKERWRKEQEEARRQQ